MTRRLEFGSHPRNGLFGVLVLACAGLVASCGGSGSAGGSSSGAAVALAPPASPDVWAVVDGREIRRDEVERVYRASLQDAAAVPTPEESLNTKLGIVEELISQDLLVARAAAAGLEPTPAEIDAAFAERKRGMSDSDFQKRMSERSLTMDDVKRAIRREIAASETVRARRDRQGGRERSGRDVVLRSQQGALQHHRDAVPARPDRGHARRAIRSFATA